nr:uncharacterized protein LOC109161160 isoform X2 [Ipomoea batatas]
MAMGPERSRPLHNFTLPCELKWGNQKFLRCVKLDSNGEIAAVHRRSNGSSEPPSTAARRRLATAAAAAAGVHRSGSNGEMGAGKKASPEKFDDGIASVREKLMFDLQTAADKMKDAILREGLKEEEEHGEEPPPPPQAAAAVAEDDNQHSPPPPATVPPPESAAADPNKPWSLRTRRSAVKPPNGFAASADGSGGSRPENNSPLPIHRSGVAAAAPPSVPSGEKRERAKFAVPLARREIEEDFMAIVGHRPARRPKKRAKLVQKNLDTLFPGLWLTEITADLYKVPDDQ